MIVCKKKLKKKIALIFVLIDILIAYLCYCATQLIFDAGANDFSSMISNCSYYAVEKCIQNDFDFSSVCQVEKDANGSITFIQTNTLLVDYFAKQLALDCYNYFDSYLKQGFSVPIGVFSGIEILAGFGRKVNIKLITTASVECQFLRTFESAGINQTRQTLTAILHTDLTV